MSATFASTFAALVVPRRLGPLALVLLAMLSAEWLASGTLLALGIDTALFALFVALPPALYRLAAPRGPWAHALYVATSGGIALAFGMVVASVDGLPFTYVVDPGAMGVLAVLFVVGGWGLGRDIDLEAHALERTLEAERSELRAERSDLRAEHNALLALRAQLDPHFLFNTLNAIAEWCREDPVVAEKATLALSAMLRSMLEGTREATWPLSRELDLVRQLASLYEIRDAGRYRFQIEAPEPLPNLTVPPMLLLPLIENAITHGPSAGHEGPIVVQVVETDGGVSIELSNPGAFAGRREGGHGIDMVEKRLRLAYGGRAALALAAEGPGTRATLSLPEHAEGEAA